MSKKLDKDIKELAKDEAMATILSDFGNSTTKQIASAWEKDCEPVDDEVIVWEVFDGYTNRELYDYWKGFADQFERLIKAGRAL